MEHLEHEAELLKELRTKWSPCFSQTFKQFYLTQVPDITVPIKLVCDISGGGKDCSWTPSQVAELIRDILWSKQNSAVHKIWPKQSATTPKL